MVLVGYVSLATWVGKQEDTAQRREEQAQPEGVNEQNTQTALINPDRLAAPAEPAEKALVATPGDTLDGLLKRLGLDSKDRTTAIQALSSEFDPKELQPGNEVVLRYQGTQQAPRELLLKIDAGVKIMLAFGDPLSVVRIAPTIIPQERAVRFKLDRSVYASLKAANAPARFAKDLSLLLAPLIQFDRAFKGGETFEILWHEYPLAGEGEAKPPEMRYVRIEMPARTIEATRSNDTDSHTRIYENGELIHTLVSPVDNGQISSVFGPRKHPVFGNVRMHTGVDYSAQRGALVKTSAPGEILYMGKRRGYGRVVEIRHEPGVVTRYAHLDSFSSNLAPGSRVSAGDIIGNVGSSGIATGPNLHFEVLRNGRPLDPFFGPQTVLSALTPAEEIEQTDLAKMRNTFSRALVGSKPSEKG